MDINTPRRIQRRRTKGWKKPENTVCVTRPGPWGNPVKVTAEITAADAVALYREKLLRELETNHSVQTELESLRGKNLACYCPLDQPCHADVLLELANGADDELHRAAE
jgi:hypothetical protein